LAVFCALGKNKTKDAVKYDGRKIIVSAVK
jgi:hypothetical protein